MNQVYNTGPELRTWAVGQWKCPESESPLRALGEMLYGDHDNGGRQLPGKTPGDSEQLEVVTRGGGGGNAENSKK